VLDLRPGEARLIAPLMVVALLVVAAQVLASISGETIFVTAFSLEQFSEFIVVSSLARVALTFGYGAVARSRGVRSEHAALLTVGVITVVMALVLRFSWRPGLYFTCVALTIVPVAAAEAVSAASEAFPARQGKRLVPLVAGCSSIGAMLAGLVTDVFARRIGTPSLVAIAAVLLLAAALVGRAAMTRGDQPFGAPAPVARSRTDVWRIPIVRLAVLFAIVVAAGNSLVDYVFKSTLKAHYARDDMAAFLGVFETALSAGTIVMQLLLTSRVTGRFGVRATLQMHPAALLLTAPVFALAPSVASATLAKGSEALMRFGAVTPTRTLLIAPLDGPARSRASLLVRGLGVALGGVMAGTVLSAFGARHAPAPHLLGGMLLVTGLLGTLILVGARKAYADALARSLGEGRLSLDVPPEQAAAMRSGLKTMLREASKQEDLPRALQVLSLLGADASKDDVEDVLTHVPPSIDPVLERQLLAVARRIGVRVPPRRIADALERTREDTTAAGATLRFEALRADGMASDEGRVRLRDAVDEGLGSPHGHVFAAAATTAMSADASAYVDRLVTQLTRGPHFGPAARALSLAGESAMGPVVAALPRAGAWAARVLAHLGPRGCVVLLEQWAELDHRTRTAAARSLAIVPDGWRGSLDREVIDRAIDTTLSTAETLTLAIPRRPSPVLEREVRRRITACAEQAVSLASIAGDAKRIAKARSALAREGRARADALELLEEVLPKAFARRTLSVLELDGARRSWGEEQSQDPWLDTCARYDRGALSSTNVVAVLDKLVVLGESSLFSGMTSEELYPVGQIAVMVDLQPGEAAVRQGDPGDAVFVVVSGTLEVKKGGRSLREVSRGAVFGEMALLDGAPRSASVEARTASRVLKIPRAEFDALLDEYPEIARGIIRTLLGHLRGQG
jgi:hypothetical protein